MVTICNIFQNIFLALLSIICTLIERNDNWKLLCSWPYARLSICVWKHTTQKFNTNKATQSRWDAGIMNTCADWCFCPVTISLTWNCWWSDQIIAFVTAVCYWTIIVCFSFSFYMWWFSAWHNYKLIKLQ